MSKAILQHTLAVQAAKRGAAASSPLRPMGVAVGAAVKRGR